MAITRVGVGALASAATGNVTPGLPAGLTDSDATTGVADLMWCIVSTNSNVAATMPAGWNLWKEINSSTSLRGSVFWKRYQAGDTDPLVTHAGGTNNTTAARIIAYRGVKGTGNGMSGTTQGTHWNQANNTANSTARQVTGITTAFADCMIAYFGVDGEEGTHAAYVGTNPSGATFLANEAMDNGVTQSSDTGLWWTDAVRSGAAGATGNISCTASITAPFVAWVIAMEPAPAVTPSSTERDARITGIEVRQTRVYFAELEIPEAAPSATETSTEVDARITGIEVRNTRVYWSELEIPAAAPSGTASDISVDVRTTGQADSSEARDVRVTGQSPSSEARDARVTGKADSADSRDVKVRGQADSDRTQDVRITGLLGSDTSLDARVTAQLDSSTSQDARITGAPGQIIRPEADVTVGAWGVAPLYEKVDEAVLDYNDYVSTSETSTMEIRYEVPQNTPGVDQSVVRYSLGKSGSGTVNYTVTLLDNTTAIETWTHNDHPAQWVEYEQVVTITNYNNLRLRIAAVIT